MSPRELIQDYLAPIKGEDPCGPSLRYEPVYHQIRDAAREEDDQLPKGIWQTELKHANWKKVASLCQEALQDQTKDLQIAAWLTEAWGQVAYFQGLYKGVLLLQALCEEFWEGVYPRPEGGDDEFRFAPFYWMNERLSERVLFYPMTNPAKEGVLRCSLADIADTKRWQDLMVRGQVTQDELRRDCAEMHRPTPEQFAISGEETPTAFYKDLRQEVATILEALLTLEKFLETKCPNTKADFPSFYKLRAALEKIRLFCHEWIEKRAETEEVPMAEAEVVHEQSEQQDTLASGADAVPTMGPLTFQLKSREMAYRQIEQIADYLAKVEPHSPTPYLLRRAARWGQMSLTAVLDEVLEDPTGMDRVQRLFGQPGDKPEEPEKK